jgi:hypothetical protein
VVALKRCKKPVYGDTKNNGSKSWIPLGQNTVEMQLVPMLEDIFWCCGCKECGQRWTRFSGRKLRSSQEVRLLVDEDA